MAQGKAKARAAVNPLGESFSEEQMRRGFDKATRRFAAAPLAGYHRTTRPRHPIPSSATARRARVMQERGAEKE